MTPQEFAAKVRTKYPGAYDSLSDDDLVTRVVAKYPQYKDQIEIPSPEPVPVMNRAIGAGETAQQLPSELRQVTPQQAIAGFEGSPEAPPATTQTLPESGAGLTALRAIEPVAKAVGTTGRQMVGEALRTEGAFAESLYSGEAGQYRTGEQIASELGIPQETDYKQLIQERPELAVDPDDLGSYTKNVALRTYLTMKPEEVVALEKAGEVAAEPFTETAETVDPFEKRVERVVNKIQALPKQKGVVRAFNEGDVTTALDLMAYNSMVSDDENIDKILEIKKSLQETPKEDKGFIKKAVEGVASIIPGMAKGFARGPASLSYWTQQGAGAVYADMREAGISPETAKKAALVAAPIYAAIEKSQLGKILKGKKGFDSISSVLRRNLTRYLTGVAEQVTEEGLQEMVLQTAQEIGEQIEDKTDQTTIESIGEILHEGWKAAVESAASLGLMQAPSAVVQTAREVGQVTPPAPEAPPPDVPRETPPPAPEVTPEPKGVDTETPRSYITTEAGNEVIAELKEQAPPPPSQQVRQEIESYAPEAQARATAGVFDPLLGQYNVMIRPEFDKVSEQMAQSDQATLVRLDVDGLRTSNDKFGHVETDENLKELYGGIVADVVESYGGAISRFGGDEFAAILPFDTETSQEIARDIQRQVDARAAEKGLSEIPNTRRPGSKGILGFSFGVADAKQGLKEAHKEADSMAETMKTAKQEGAYEPAGTQKETRVEGDQQRGAPAAQPEPVSPGEEVRERGTLADLNLTDEQFFQLPEAEQAKASEKLTQAEQDRLVQEYQPPETEIKAERKRRKEAPKLTPPKDLAVVTRDQKIVEEADKALAQVPEARGNINVVMSPEARYGKKGAQYRFQEGDEAAIHVDRETGEATVYINPSLPKERVARVMTHEILGHYGASRVIAKDPELGKVLRRVWKDDSNSQYVKDLRKRYEAVEGITDDQIMDEWVAERLSDYIEGGKKTGVARAVYNTVKKWLQKIGVVAKDVDYVMEQIAKQLKTVTPKGPKTERVSEVISGQEAEVPAKSVKTVGKGEKKRYVGVPPHVKNPSALARLRKQITEYAEKGEITKHWYEKSGKHILELTGGNKEDAEKIVQIIAITSPQRTLKANTADVIKTWADYESQKTQGVPPEDIELPRVGLYPVQNEKKIRDLIVEGKPWEGRKTNNFYINLMRVIDPDRPQGVTVDLWMARAFGFPNDAPTNAQYTFMENTTIEIAKKLGWEPQQVQAAIWNTIRARWEAAKPEATKRGLKDGWAVQVVEKVNGREVRRNKVIDKNAEHRAIVEETRLFKGDYDVQDYSYRDTFLEAEASFNWEATPGKSTGHMAGIHDAPFEQRVEYHQAIQAAMTGPDSKNIILKELGLLEAGNTAVPGAWQFEINPTTQYAIPVTSEGDGKGRVIRPQEKKLLTVASALMGYYTHQEGVGFHQPYFQTTKKRANGVQLGFGRIPTVDEVDSMYRILHQLTGKDPDMIPNRSGIRVMNFSDTPNTQWHEIVKKAASRLDVDEITFEVFAHDGDLITNNWEEAKNGEDYRQRISSEGFADFQRRIDGVLRAQIGRIDRYFAGKYGWKPREDFIKEEAPEETITLSRAPSTESGEFKKWFGDSKIVNRRGEPHVLYHGTLTRFTSFNVNRTNVESDVGAGFYFTTSTEDASKNYANVYGPDIQLRIEDLADRLLKENEDKIVKPAKTKWDQPQYYDERYARQDAIKQLTEHEGAVMPVYLQVSNPAVIGMSNNFDFELDETILSREEYEKLVDNLSEAIDEIESNGGYVYYKDNLIDTLLGFTGVEMDFSEYSIKDFYTMVRDKANVTDVDDKYAVGEVFRRALEKSGFDGIVDYTVGQKFMMPGLEEAAHVIVFKPTQIKSAIGNRGTYDPEEANIVLSRAPTYSQLEREIEQRMPNSATPEVVRNLLKRGVKEEEVKWTDIEGFLEGKEVVNKKELLQHIRDNQIQVEEEYDQQRRFGQYTLPGGEEYEEILFRISHPKIKGVFKKEEHFPQTNVLGHIRKKDRNTGVSVPIEGKPDFWYTAVYDKPQDLYVVKKVNKFQDVKDAEIVDSYMKGHQADNAAKMMNEDAGTFEPGFSDTKKEKVFFLEEIQSDWHQTGREKGYTSPEWYYDVTGSPKYDGYVVKRGLNIDGFNWRDAEIVSEVFKDGEEADKYANELNKKEETGRGKTPEGAVPDAPFKKNWHEYLFRRALRLAAESGADYMGWTTGDVQNERNALETYIDSIRWTRFGNRATSRYYNIVAYSDYDVMVEESAVQEKNLKDYFGEEIANRIIEKENKERVEDEELELSGLEIRTGGEGMRNFYDRMIPKYAKKYVKKWGSEVEQIDIEDIDTPQWAVRITPEMKSAVEAGEQPTFSRREAAENLARELDEREESFKKRWKWARELGNSLTLRNRVFIEREIGRHRMERREELVNAVRQYAKEIGLQGYPRNRVDTLMNKVRTTEGFRKALDVMDQVLEARQKGILRKKVKAKIAREVIRIRRLEGKGVPTTDYTANRLLQQYIKDLTGQDFEDTRKVMTWYLENAREPGKQTRFDSDAHQDMIQWLEKPNQAVPGSVTAEIIKAIKPTIDQMSAEELQGVADDIEFIKREGRTRRQAEIDKRNAELDRIARVSTDRLSKGKKPEHPAVAARKGKGNIWGKIGPKFAWGHIDPERIIEWFAGQGLFKRETFGKVIDAERNKLVNTKKAVERFKEIHSGIDFAEMQTPFMDIVVENKEAQTSDTIPLTIEQAMFIYANSQNPGNRAHLNGTGYQDELIDEIVGKLPQKYKDTVDKMIDYFDTEQYPRVSEVFRIDHQVDMPKEHRYFPIMNISTDRAESALTADLLARHGSKHAAVGKSFTKNRVNSQAPFGRMQYFETAIRSIIQAEHYIAYNRAVKEVQQVFNHPDIAEAMKARSEEAYGQLKRWLKAVAYGRVGDSEHWISQFAQGVRSNFAVAVLGFNLTTILQQPSSFFKGVAFTKKGSVLNALGAWTINPLKTAKFIDSKSPFMANRANSYERELAELAEKEAAKKILGKNVLGKFREFAMMGIAITDKVSAGAVWLGKYNEVLRAGGSEETAIDKADELVRKTQSRGDLYLLPEVYRGNGLERAYTMFTSDLNQNLNWAFEFLTQQGEKPTMQKAQELFWYVTVPTAWVYVMTRARFGEDEPEEWAKHFVSQFTGGVALLGAVIEGFVGGIANKILASRGGRPDKLELEFLKDVTPTGFGVVEDFIDAVGASEGYFDAANKLFDAAVKLAGLPGVIPIKRAGRQLKRAIEERDPRYLVWSKYRLDKRSVKAAMHSRAASASHSVEESLTFVKWWQKRGREEQREFIIETAKRWKQTPGQVMGHINSMQTRVANRNDYFMNQARRLQDKLRREEIDQGEYEKQIKLLRRKQRSVEDRVQAMTR